MVLGSQDKSHQLINGYGRQFEIERKARFTEDGVETRSRRLTKSDHTDNKQRKIVTVYRSAKT